MSTPSDPPRPDRTETRATSVARGEHRTGPLLFRVIHCDRPLRGGARYDLSAVSSVEIGRGDDGAAVLPHDAGPRLRVQVQDRWMSSRHARIERALTSWVLHDDGAKNPTLLRGEPVRRAVLADGDCFEVGGTLFVFRASMPAGSCASVEFAPDPSDVGVTLVPALSDELARLAVIARAELPVLLRGEAGAGKAHVARALHARSGRRGAFVVAHGSLDDDTLRRARGGTLYVDELRDLDADAQAALLRALREGESGAAELRVVCATHGALDDAALRPDLAARLSVYPFTLPPLRERREDLGLLVGAALSRVAPDRATSLRVEPAAARAMWSAAWPNNLRGLEGALAAAAALARDGVITLDHLPEALRAPPVAQAPATVASAAAPEAPLSLRLEGEYWTVTWSSVLLRQKDSVGMRYLAHLVERPGVEVHVSDLVRVVRKARPDDVEPVDAGADDAGPMLDDAAKAAYRRRLEDLRETVEEATGWGDRERAARAQSEIDAISGELARAVGLGGRDRKASASSERLRVSVTLRIRDAMKRLDEGSAALGRHLAASVRTGAFCAYDPR